MDGGRHIGPLLVRTRWRRSTARSRARPPPGTEDDQEADHHDGGRRHRFEGGPVGCRVATRPPSPTTTRTTPDHDPDHQGPAGSAGPAARAPAPARRPGRRKAFSSSVAARHTTTSPGGPEGDRPDEVGGETEPQGLERQQGAAEDGGQGQSQGHRPPVGQRPPADRKRLPLAGHDQPGQDVEGEPRAVADGQDGEHQAEDVGIDPEAGRQTAGHAGRPSGPWCSGAGGPAGVGRATGPRGEMTAAAGRRAGAIIGDGVDDRMASTTTTTGAVPQVEGGMSGCRSGSYPIPDGARGPKMAPWTTTARPRSDPRPGAVPGGPPLGPGTAPTTGPPDRGRRSSRPRRTTARPPGPERGEAGRIGPGPVHRLRRDTEHRMLGGVAAGLARYLDVDVVFVRVAFAVLTVFGGTGSAHLPGRLAPHPGRRRGAPLAQQWAGRGHPGGAWCVIIVGVVLGLIALSDLFWSGPWWPHRHGGFRPRPGRRCPRPGPHPGGRQRREPDGRLPAALVVRHGRPGLVAVLVVAAATVFSIEAASGVPLRGGIGATQFRPDRRRPAVHPTTGWPWAT